MRQATKARRLAGMRYVVRVEAVGTGPVDDAALSRFREQLGADALEVGAEPGAWWVRVAVHADTDNAAGDIAYVNVLQHPHDRPRVGGGLFRG